MESFAGRLAVVTGAGTGMGRELGRQLAEAGASVALGDVVPDTLAESAALAERAATGGARVSRHVCDVADERQVIAFRDAVLADHATDHVDLLFNNAGIAGAGSFVRSSRHEWERVFAVCWGGVYLCTRAFLPSLVASDDAVVVNTSSVNGFWATLGPGIPHSAYSTAKFAVKGFTESLMVDLQANAPHVRAVLVMPGHVGTDIVINSRRLLGGSDELSDADLQEARETMGRLGVPVDTMDDEALRSVVRRLGEDFRDSAPLSAGEAATIILDGVLSGRWRILVGEDARQLDELVRGDPEGAYSLRLPLPGTMSAD
jgi:NAD(P)-dependent dehydrogenase (short-subunit alcohol dehydrogenase family)